MATTPTATSSRARHTPRNPDTAGRLRYEPPVPPVGKRSGCGGRDRTGRLDPPPQQTRHAHADTRSARRQPPIGRDSLPPAHPCSTNESAGQSIVSQGLVVSLVLVTRGRAFPSGVPWVCHATVHRRQRLSCQSTHCCRSAHVFASPLAHDNLPSRSEPPTAWLRNLGWMRMTASPGDVVLAVVPGLEPDISTFRRTRHDVERG